MSIPIDEIHDEEINDIAVRPHPPEGGDDLRSPFELLQAENVNLRKQLSEMQQVVKDFFFHGDAWENLYDHLNDYIDEDGEHYDDGVQCCECEVVVSYGCGDLANTHGIGCSTGRLDKIATV